jgi:hypothetical protein
MDCPICQADVDLGNLRIEDNEGDLEIGFTCCGCDADLYTIVFNQSFVPVD